jgi:TolA-binding protein
VHNLPASSYYHQSLYLLGRSEYLLGSFERAIQLFDVYLDEYPTEDYADNSIYWKGESLLAMGERDGARAEFERVLATYPDGNKADAARFKLRLMDIEDELAAREGIPPEAQAAEKPPTDDGGDGEQWEDREKQYLSEIEKMNQQIEKLRTEIDALREIGEQPGTEETGAVEERMKALIAWENILKLKEETLNQKEQQLDQEFERIQQLSEELEQIENE